MEFQKFIKQAGLESKSYQESGVKWCIRRESEDIYGCTGGIIADEMGLGKTIMMIGTMIENFKMSNLIILPLVLLEQWVDQIKRTTGHMPLVYHGQIKKTLTKEMLQRVPIVITTYGTMVSDSKSDQKLEQVAWKRIIFDEAHHLRNKQTQCFRSAMTLKSEVKWLISGTPIQNHINDLYALFDILGISNKIYTDNEKLREIMNAVVLKRTKTEVGIQLPTVHKNRISTSWKNDDEKKLAQMVHNNIGVDPRMILAMMMYERMMCVYPALLTKKSMERINESGIDDEYNKGANYHSKLDNVIHRIVERKDNKNNKIIFANFKGEIDYIKQELTSKGMSVEYIDGRVTKRQRKIILANTVDVLILQIKTGNEGLNLQNYNEVYFVTPDWNPQTEEQAIARCHRIGQKKEVFVFRFIMNSFNEDNGIDSDNGKESTSSSNIEQYSEKVQKMKIKIGEKVYQQ